MKKIINKCLWAGGLVLLAGCQSAEKESDNSRTNEQILEEVTEVNAIGKVVPASDWAIISSPASARIQRILVQVGDSVALGQPLLVLDSGNAALDLAEARARLTSLQAEHRSAEEELHKAEVQAAALKSVHETSQRLLELGAETREQAESDRVSWQQQEQTVRALAQQLRARRATEQEQAIQIKKATNDLAGFQIGAPQAGIVTDLVARVGQHVSGAEELGRIAATLAPIVEAEVDELFAQDIQVGQPAYIVAAGRPDTLARGHVSYASPVLSDKSILYETANEGEDRRVRRIKIVPDSTVSLPINAKVACIINIR